MTKRCSVCDTVKPFSAFYKATKAADGYANRCKDCDTAYQRGRKAEKAASNKRWYEKNKDAYLAAQRRETKEKRQAYLHNKLAKQDVVGWRKQQARRALQKRTATPVWVDAVHRARIRQIYAVTQELQELTATVYNVDHIVPLFSDIVCGLHVWWNLQPIPEALNMQKNNTFDPQFYPEQNVVAFPSGDGLTSAQSAVLLEEKVENSDE